MMLEILRYIYAATISFGLAVMFFLADRQPDRNSLTRLLARYAEVRVVRGLEAPPGGRLLKIAFICAGLGVFIVILGLVKLS